MNAKKFFPAFLVSFVVMFLLAGLGHIVLLGDFFDSHTAKVAREATNTFYVGLGIAILAFLMAFVYPVGYKGGSPTGEGLRFGVIIGLIWILPWSVVIHGIWHVPGIAVVVDSVWHIVEQGIGGLVIGVIYGRSIASR